MTLSSIIKMLIVDDNLRVRTSIEEIIKQQPGALVVGSCGSVQEASILIRATTPDLLLIAVELSDGTGFDIVRSLSPVSFKVLFLAASEADFSRAARFGPTLLKPVNADELLQQIELIMPQIAEAGNLRRHQRPPRLQQRLLLRTQQYLQVAEFTEIIYFRGGDAYTTVYLTDDRKVLTSRYLKEYEDMLPQSQFLRPHQSYIVNVRFIEKFLREGTLILRDGSKIPVSSRKRDMVVNFLAG